MTSDNLNIYFDLRVLVQVKSQINQYVSDSQKQILHLRTLNKPFSIKITLPNNLLEWFIEILVINGQKITSTWVDHYGDTNEKLVAEMRDEIYDFINAISTKMPRVFEKDKSITFQYFDGQNWQTFDTF